MRPTVSSLGPPDTAKAVPMRRTDCVICEDDEAVGNSFRPSVTTMARNAIDTLGALYVEQHAVLIRRDGQRTPRRLVPAAIASELFLIGQALGRDTQRLSGFPYIF